MEIVTDPDMRYVLQNPQCADDPGRQKKLERLSGDCKVFSAVWDQATVIWKRCDLPRNTLPPRIDDLPRGTCV